MSAQNKLPTGFRFRPTQKELIFYLRKWVSDKEIPPAAGVRFEDIYGEEEPWEMCERWAVKEDGEAVYVLTKLKKTKEGGQRINRAVGKSGGSWLADRNGDPFTVEIEEGQSLDCSKRGYKYKNTSSNQFRWVMKEYSCPSLFGDRVICKLGRKELVVNGDGSSSGLIIDHGVLEANPGPEMAMPPGVRFHPTKEELLGYYLYNMVTKGRADLNECDLYGTEEPWEVWDRFSKEWSSSSSSKDLYFFTKLKRQRPTGARISRRVGNGGIWDRGKGLSFKVKIMISDESKVYSGERTTCSYKTEKESSDRGKWSLHVYSCQELSEEVVVGVLRNRGGAVKEEGHAEDDDLDAKRNKMKKGIGGSVQEEVSSSTARNDDVVDLDDPEGRMNVAGALKLKCGAEDDDLDDPERKKMKKSTCQDDDAVGLDDAERRMNVAGDADIEDGQVRTTTNLERFKEEEDLPKNWLGLSSTQE